VKFIGGDWTEYTGHEVFAPDAACLVLVAVVAAKNEVLPVVLNRQNLGDFGDARVAVGWILQEVDLLEVNHTFGSAKFEPPAFPGQQRYPHDPLLYQNDCFIAELAFAQNVCEIVIVGNFFTPRHTDSEFFSLTIIGGVEFSEQESVYLLQFE